MTKRILLLDFLRGHRLLIGLMLLTGLLNSFVILLLPISLGKYYQLVFGSQSNRGRLLDYLGLPLTQNVTDFFVFFGTLIVLRGVFTFLEQYLTGLSGEHFAKALRERLFSHQLAVLLTVHQRKPVGKYLLRYGGDLKSIRNYLTKGLIGFVRDVLFTSITFALLALIQPQLTLIILGCLPVLFGLILLSNRHLKGITQRRRDIRSGNVSFVSSRLTALLTVKVFNRERVETEKFAKRSEKLWLAGRRYQRWAGLIEAFLPVLLYALLLVVLYAIYRMKSGGGHVDGGILLTFILLLLTLFPVLKRILKVDVVWQAGNISFAKLVALLNTETETQLVQPTASLKPGEVTFRNVTFSYQPQKPVFENLSFTAQPGSITQLMGAQGAGKSTVFKLLLKLHEPLCGSILLDGQDIASHSAKSVRKHVTLVSEEALLLGETVFEAVSYSRKPENREKAQAMLQKLRVTLQRGEVLRLDDPVGELGANLSAGQKKMLLLARALLTGKKVLLLDEPFSGLDTAARQHLVALINDLALTHTLLLTDHSGTSGLRVGQVVGVGLEPAVEVHLASDWVNNVQR